MDEKKQSEDFVSNRIKKGLFISNIIMNKNKQQLIENMDRQQHLPTEFEEYSNDMDPYAGTNNGGYRLTTNALDEMDD